MPEHFEDAALRHWHDANILDQNNRTDNADQLYGIAAECAIKVALLLIPQCVNPETGRLSDRYLAHIDKLSQRVCLQGIQKRYPGLFCILRQSPLPFSDWAVEQRYNPTNSISTDTLKRHKNLTCRILSSVGLNGIRTGRK
jgi:hypothetical protein